MTDEKRLARQPRRALTSDTGGPHPGLLLAHRRGAARGGYPGAANEDSAKASLTKFLDAGIRTFIDLTETTESLAKYDGLLRSLSAERGVATKHVRVGIRDRSMPLSGSRWRVFWPRSGRDDGGSASLRALLGRHWPDGNGRRLLAGGSPG